MQMQNRSARRPWAGSLALILGVTVAGIFLWRVDFTAMFQPWYLSRAAGLIAYALLWASVSVGLLQSLGMLKGVTGPVANLDVHEYLGLWSIYAATFHAVILLWDHYVPFDLWEITLPFVSDYKPGLVAPGIAALYITLLVTVTTYLRTRLSTRLWRGIHLLSLVGFLFALFHGAAMGTDAGHPAVSYLYRFTGISVGLLLILRLFKEVRARYANPAGRG